MRNLITDVRGVRVGQAHDENAATGVTIALFERPTVASIAILGGAPGTRDTALLEPEMTVEHIDAIVLSGGSAWGLSAADGVMAWLAGQGRGFPIGPLRVPIVPQAILFDLLNGGDKPWAKGGAEPPYRKLGALAAEAAALDFALGTAGAGFGATTQNLKGGIGSASARAATGHVLGALVAVNAVGTATIGDGPHFWAAPYEQAGEFGGRGWPAAIAPDDLALRFKGGTAANTTIALVATDAVLTKAQCKRLALAAHDGLARSLRPAHGALDGDVVCASTSAAVARGVHAATALPFASAKPAWRDRFGG